MTYRDELDAARIRRENLQRELAHLDRHLASARAIATRRAELASELADASRSVDRARAKVALPLLSRVQIASPCSARWEDMRGDDHVRHCASCDKKVFDLSSIRAEQAEALLRAHGTALCARFYRRADGTVMTSDCSVGARRVRMRNLALVGATATMLGMGFVSAIAGAAFLLARAQSVEVVELPPPPIVLPPESVPAAGGISFVENPDLEPDVVSVRGNE